jgi:activator of HSP90 ATPase
MKNKIIKQQIVFDATPDEIYSMLMSSVEHKAFTGDKAVISGKVGGKFSVFSGYAYGTNLELVPGKKIVQKWTSSDLPEGHFTQVTFQLKKQANKTLLAFTQSKVPEENYKSLSDGWKEFYWNPMKQFIKNKNNGG